MLGSNVVVLVCGGAKTQHPHTCHTHKEHMCTATRSALLMLLAGMRHVRWTLEQPTTSLMPQHKTLQHVLKKQEAGGKDGELDTP